jgi:large subunit ribosomal protein LP2
MLRVVGVEADSAQLSKLLSEVAGKDISALIAEGRKKLASLPAAGVAAAPAAGAAAPAAGAAPAAKKEEKKKEESEEEVGSEGSMHPKLRFTFVVCLQDMGFSLFD